MAVSHPTPQDSAIGLSERLTGAGLDDVRLVSVESGGKRCYDHETAVSPEDVDGNYGVYASKSDQLVVLDIDDYDDDDGINPGLAAVEQLPETYTQESPHGGTHRFYRVEIDDGRFPGAVFEDVFGTQNPVASWGETVVANKYVVGAGSVLDSCGKEWHDCSGDDSGYYTVETDAEIASVSADEMVTVLSADEKIEKEEDGDGSSDDDPQTDGGFELEDRIETAKEKSDEFRRLWKGTHSQYNSDRSEAECHLAARLSFWLGGDEKKVEKAMDMAGPPKWEERDDDSYRESVLEAVDEVSEYYTPSSNGVSSLDYDVGSFESMRKGLQEIRENDDVTKEGAKQMAAEVIYRYNDFIKPRSDVPHMTEELYRYVEGKGVYEPHGETYIMKLVEDYLPGYASTHFVNEVVDSVERKSITHRVERPSEHHLCVENGIVDLETGELLDHTPEEVHTSRIPVEYDPDAECPEIDSFLHSIVDDEDVRLLYRTISHCIYPGYPGDWMVMLVGEGSNGKSMFLSLIEELLGRRNVSHQSIHELVEERFSKVELRGTFANLHGDMSGETVRDTSTLKMLTSDRIDAEKKYEPSKLKFRNKATMVFAMNNVPEFREDDHALWRRWVYVNFPYTFTPDSDGYVPEDELKDRIFDEDELRGLLARAVQECVDATSERKWFDVDPMDVRRQIKAAAEPVFQFAEDCLWGAEEVQEKKDYDEDDLIELRQDVYDAYCTYAFDESLPSMRFTQFQQRLVEVSDYPVKKKRSRSVTNGRGRDQVFTGVMVNPEAAAKYLHRYPDGHEEKFGDYGEQSRMDTVSGRDETGGEEQEQGSDRTAGGEDQEQGGEGSREGEDEEEGLGRRLANGFPGDDGETHQEEGESSDESVDPAELGRQLQKPPGYDGDSNKGGE